MTVIVRSAPLSTCTNARLWVSGRPVAQLVIAERGQEETAPSQACELDGSHCPASGGLLPAVERVHDLARRRHALHARELDPFDVTDDGDPHAASILQNERAMRRLATSVALAAIAAAFAGQSQA